MSKTRENRAALGQCIGCGHPRDSHKKHCAACLGAISRRYRNGKAFVVELLAGPECECGNEKDPSKHACDRCARMEAYRSHPALEFLSYKTRASTIEIASAVELSPENVVITMKYYRAKGLVAVAKQGGRGCGDAIVWRLT